LVSALLRTLQKKKPTTTTTFVFVGDNFDQAQVEDPTMWKDEALFSPVNCITGTPQVACRITVDNLYTQDAVIGGVHREVLNTPISEPLNEGYISLAATLQVIEGTDYYKVLSITKHDVSTGSTSFANGLLQ